MAVDWATNPDAWAAAGGWTTAAIALIASIAAFRQVREARELREEQAQPYVVAYMEPNQASQHIIDLVVKNFGTTVARNVRMECDPPLDRTSSTGDGFERVRLFESLPVLVPGQEWRIFWDSGIERKDAKLPERYEVAVSYQDSRDRSMTPTTAILDWGIYKSRMWVENFGQHHAAKALREISSVVKKWGEFGGGPSVYVRDGDSKDEASRTERAEMMERMKEINSRVLSTGGSSNEAEDPAVAGSAEPNGKKERPPAATDS